MQDRLHAISALRAPSLRATAARGATGGATGDSSQPVTATAAAIFALPFASAPAVTVATVPAHTHQPAPGRPTLATEPADPSHLRHVVPRVVRRRMRWVHQPRS